MLKNVKKILFIHPNFPGQYKHLSQHLTSTGRYEMACICDQHKAVIPGIRKIGILPVKERSAGIHRYLRRTEQYVYRGQDTWRACYSLSKEGFIPDLIVGHSGWGDMLFIKDIFPKAVILNYCEFYYRGLGADLHYDPAEPINPDAIAHTRLKNTHLLLSLETATAGISPTHWQKSLHPPEFHDKISVIHEGFDTQVVRPNPDAVLTLPNGSGLTKQDMVLTYVARNLEPYRGFPIFMEVATRLLQRHPTLQIVVVGGDRVSYGAPLPNGKTYRDALCAQYQPDLSRLHFLGHIPYSDYLTVLQISTVHLYLTIPFVLSWSMLEAMATGCLVVGSDVAPVLEVIEDGKNGFIVPLLDSKTMTSKVEALLTNAKDFDPIRTAARQTVNDRYEVGHCLRQQIELITQLF